MPLRPVGWRCDEIENPFDGLAYLDAIANARHVQVSPVLAGNYACSLSSSEHARRARSFLDRSAALDVSHGVESSHSRPLASGRALLLRIPGSLPRRTRPTHPHLDRPKTGRAAITLEGANCAHGTIRSNPDRKLKAYAKDIFTDGHVRPVFSDSPATRQGHDLARRLFDN
jgi:hypothetical protein